MYSTTNPPSSYGELGAAQLRPNMVSTREEEEEEAGRLPLSSTGSYYDSKEEAAIAAASRVGYYDRSSKAREPWSSGLFDCFSDLKNCFVTFWCPCVTFGRIAEIVDKGSSSCGVNGAMYTLIACVTFCPCCYSCFYRAKMRQQFFLKKHPCGDCLVHCFCECCALCQEYRELQGRGYDLSIGWHGNVEQKHRLLEMAVVPPVVEGGMSR